MLKRAKEPMQFAGCYTLDLYCDRADVESPTTCSPDGLHDWNEFPHTFTGETFAECARAAKMRGWRIHRQTRTATCPKCVERKTARR